MPLRKIQFSHSGTHESLPAFVRATSKKLFKNSGNCKNVVISTGDARLYRAAEWRNPRISLLLSSVDLSASSSVYKFLNSF